MVTDITDPTTDGYYEELQKRYADALKSQLGNYPTMIANREQATRDKLGNLTQGYQKRTQDILGQVGGQYNLSPSISQSGSAQFNTMQPKVNRTRESFLSYQKMKDYSDYYNKQYNYAVTQYQQAGYTKQQAEQFARAWATQQADQQFQAEQAQSSRDYAQKRSDISAQYQDIKAGMSADTGDLYQQAVINALLRSTGQIGAMTSVS